MALVSIVVLATTACGTSNAPSPTRCSSASTVASAATTSPNSQSSPGTEADRNSALAYLRSPSRIQRYEKVWPAATKVARALLEGACGDIKKYTDAKTPLTPDYIGWGGMQTTDGQTYAWVWWNAGTADLNKGVTGFALRGQQIESIDAEGPYTVFTPKRGYTSVTSPAYFGGISPTAPYRYPVTLSELTALDEEALSLLETNMKKAGLA